MEDIRNPLGFLGFTFFFVKEKNEMKLNLFIVFIVILQHLTPLEDKIWL